MTLKTTVGKLRDVLNEKLRRVGEIGAALRVRLETHAERAAGSGRRFADQVLLRKTTPDGQLLEIGAPDREKIVGDWIWTFGVAIDGNQIGRGYMFPVAETEGEPPLFSQFRQAGFSHGITTRPVVGLTPEDAAILFESLRISQASRLRPLSWWLDQAGLGDPFAMFVLAFRPEFDEETKEYWMRRAAQAGHGGAQFNVGLFYSSDEDEELRWLIMAARQGVDAAYHVLEIETVEELNDWRRRLRGNFSSMLAAPKTLSPAAARLIASCYTQSCQP